MRCSLGRPFRPSSRVTTFSTTTTEESTIMPMAMTSPPRLMRVGRQAGEGHQVKVASAASGSDSETTSAARILPRNTASRTTTMRMASNSALDMV